MTTTEDLRAALDEAARLRAEVERLRSLVQSAYREGWRDSRHGASLANVAEGWKWSDSRKELEARP